MIQTALLPHKSEAPSGELGASNTDSASISISHFWRDIKRHGASQRVTSMQLYKGQFSFWAISHEDRGFLRPVKSSKASSVPHLLQM